MARICLIANLHFHHAGGLQITIYSIIKHLIMQGHEVTLICLRQPTSDSINSFIGGSFDSNSWKALGSSLGSLPYAKLVGRILISQKFKQVANEIDMIIDIDGGYIDLPDTLRQKYVIYSLSVPPGYYNLDSIEDTKRRILEPLYNKIATNMTRPLKEATIASVSLTRARMFTKRWSINVQHILYPAITMPSSAEINYDAKKNAICILGRISPEKRIIFALEAFSSIHKRRIMPDGATLIIAGAVSSKKYFHRILEMIKRMQLSDKVEVFPNTSREKINNILSESKILLSCQVDPESYNIAILEGMSHGCIPVVPMGRLGAWDEILEDGKYGYGYSNVDECADILENIISMNQDEFLSRSKEAISRARCFDEAQFSSQLSKLVATILRQSS